MVLDARKEEERKTERLGEIMTDVFVEKLIEKEDMELTEEEERELAEKITDRIVEEDLV